MNARQLLELSQQGVELVFSDPISTKEDILMYIEIIAVNILLFIWFITRK